MLFSQIRHIKTKYSLIRILLKVRTDQRLLACSVLYQIIIEIEVGLVQVFKWINPFENSALFITDSLF